MVRPAVDPVSELRIERTVHAPPGRVFEAFLQVDELRHWYAPEGVEVAEIEADARVGGRWSVRMHDPRSGDRFQAEGVYREISPPERLVFTHYWLHDDPPVETEVTVELHDEGGATRIVMTHTGLPTTESRSGHEEGWKSCLNRLEGLFG